MPCCIEDRWEAGQTLSRKLMLDLIVAEQKGQKLSVDSAFIEGIRSTLTNSSLDKVCLYFVKALYLLSVDRGPFTRFTVSG